MPICSEKTMKICLNSCNRAGDFQREARPASVPEQLALTSQLRVPDLSTSIDFIISMTVYFSGAMHFSPHSLHVR